MMTFIIILQSKISLSLSCSYRHVIRINGETIDMWIEHGVLITEQAASKCLDSIL